MMVRENGCVKRDLGRRNPCTKRKTAPVHQGRLFFPHGYVPYFCSARFAAQRRFAASDILRLAASLTL